MHTSRFVKYAAISALVLIAAACSSSSSSDDGVATNVNDAGGANDGGGTTNSDDSGTTTKTDGGSTPTDSGGGPVDSGILTSADGFGALRTTCITEINRLRATEGHAAFALATSPTLDACVDGQAATDELQGVPHYAFDDGMFCGDVSGYNFQNECPSIGSSPSDLVACLDQMWAEKDQSGCSGCAACASAYTADCPNCPVNGSTVCGHYINLSADYLTSVACGFSTLDGGGGGMWAAQDFH
jgi:hypothetical protein